MSRYSKLEACVLAVAVALLALPSLALADVLEIGPGGAHWVAGGPVSAPNNPTLLPEASDASAAVPSSAVGLTEVATTAGPEQWRAYVAELAARFDLSPALLEALVWQESRWKQSALSPVGARGLAQLMPGTARQLGVNPDDPRANLEGGARYLRMQLDTFDGNLEKALAAYNAGPGRVIKAGGIPAIRETRNYVASIMARLSEPVRR